MSILKNMFNIITDNRDIKEPILYKESSETSNLLSHLTELEGSHLPHLDVKKIQNHHKLFSIGHTGEKQVLFELQNAMIPYLILHDVSIEFQDYKAQMDFIVITHKFILVLEVKKLFGNIKVTDKGEFQRVIMKNNRVVNHEGMYSPINQVSRHVEILEKLLTSDGTITKCPIKYAVTFANPKTILDISSNAPETIQSNVIRHDQIKPFLKKELEKKSPVFMLDQQLHKIADAILQNHQPKPFNQADYKLNIPQATGNHVSSYSNTKNAASTNQDLKTMLIDYRLKKSKELAKKPYHIFTNKTVEELVEMRPSSSDKLLEIEGIGPKKATEFGDDLLVIIRSSKASDSTYLKEETQNINNEIPESLRLSLIDFRSTRSKVLNVKPYYIFTNRTLEEILIKKPVTMNELLHIDGIGPKKAEEFGKDIIDLIKKQSI